MTNLIRPKHRLLFEHLWGLSLAFYYLVGRWTPSRLTDTTVNGEFLTQPRLWIVIVMALLFLVGPSTYRRTVFQPNRVALLSAALVLYMILSACWAHRSIDNHEKASDLILLFAAHLLALHALRTTDAQKLLDSFWLGIMVCTLLMATLGIVSIGSGRLAVLGGGPNVFGRNMVLMLMAVAYCEARYKRAWGPLTAAALIASSMLVILSGSRGAILSLVAGILALAFFSQGKLFRRVAFATLAAVGATIVLVTTSLGNMAASMFHDRIVVATITNRYTSERDELFSLAFQTGMEYPVFGVGLDGFRQWVSVDYPHNFILELFAEGGGIAMLLLALTTLAMYRSFKRQRLYLNPFTFSAFAVVFVAAQFSGDLYDSRGIFLFAMLTLVPDRKLLYQALPQMSHKRHRSHHVRLQPQGTR